MKREETKRQKVNVVLALYRPARTFSGLLDLFEVPYDAATTFWGGVVEASITPDEWDQVSIADSVEVRLEDGRVGCAKVLADGEASHGLGAEAPYAQLRIVGVTGLMKPMTREQFQKLMRPDHR